MFPPVALLDAEAFFFVVSKDFHRALFHNVLIPTIVTTLIIHDTAVQESSYISHFVDPRYVSSIAVASYISVILAGAGVNVF